MASGRDRFYFPPPVDIDTRRSTAETVAQIATQLATQPDLVPIRSQALNAALAVQKLEQSENARSDGVFKLLSFSGSGGLNTTDWTSDPAVFVVSNSEMALAGSVANALFIARVNYLFATDDQAIVFKLGANANNDQYTYVLIRQNVANNQAVALRFSANSLAIGTIDFPGDGSTTSGFTPAKVVTRGVASSDSIEIRAVGNNFAVLVNGSPTPALEYAGALGSVGSSWRGASVIKQKATGLFVYYSFNISSFGMYDFGTVGSSITDRTGARISRLSNSPVNLSVANGATALVPDGFYSTTDFAQGMTVTDMATGAIRADTAAWYKFTAGLAAKYENTQQTSSQEFWGQTWWCLVVNGVVVSPALLVGTEFPWALNVGDVARAGVANAMSIVVSSNPTGSGDSNIGIDKPANIKALAGSPGAFFQALIDI